MKDCTVATRQLPETVTARLRLRCVSPSDATTLSVLMTSGISRWLASWDYPLSVESAAKRIEALQDRALLKEVLPCMIVGRSAEHAIGWISVQRSASSPSRGELSYWIGEEHQGKGYAQEAVSAMLPAAAKHLALASIEAGAQVENVSSFAVMMRCGMIPATERLVYAPTRARNELCLFYEWVPQAGEPSLPPTNTRRKQLMRSRFALIFAVVLLLIQNGHAQSPSAENAIRAVLARETDGWEKFDPEEVASTYTGDAIWQNPFGVRLHGKAEIQKFLTDLMSRPGYRAGKDTSPITILDLHLTSPTTAAVWSDERIVGLINDNSGNPMQPRHSYYLKVLVKRDGAWKISDNLIMDTIHLK